MRNVIRNILTKWSNVFGRFEIKGLLYSGLVPNNGYVNVDFESGDEVPATIEFIYIQSGIKHSDPYTINTPNTLQNFDYYGLTANTRYYIAKKEGDIDYLEVNGEVIFDNR